MGRYSKYYSNYILRKKHQVTHKGTIFERDWVTIGGQHQIEKGKKPYYSDTNFLFTDNSYPSYKKKHNYGKWVAHWDYDDVKTASGDVNTVKVNTSSNDIRDFAYYGSAVELVKSSVTDIINWFPARVTLSSDGIYIPTSSGGYRQLNGYYLLNNPFEVDFIHTLSDNEKQNHNVDRFLMHSYLKYTIDGSDIETYETINRRFMVKPITRTVHFIEKKDVYNENDEITGEEIVREYDEIYGYESWQFFTDDEYEDALNNGWSETSFCGFTWLPDMMLERTYYEEGLTIEYKTIEEKYEKLSAAGQEVLKSWLSSEEGITALKNFPLYTIKINGNIDIEAYIINNESVVMTSDSNLEIKTKKEVFDEYFRSLEGFEKQLLTLDSKPLYKNSFLTPIEGELVYKYVYRDYIWPSSFDEELGYGHIDIVSDTYVGYLSKLIDMATVFDELWCDNLYRNMTHESIKNFDWTYTREYNEGEEQDNIDGGNQIMKLLRVYGRAFDDIKRLVDGIGFITKNTYDGYGNQPEAEITDKLETMGWDITSIIPTFPDAEQGYIGKNTGYVINKETFDNLSEEEKDEYELAYINADTAQIIGKHIYNDLEDIVKKKFKKYFPTMDLSDVTIDKSFTDTFDKKDGSTHATWFNSTNSDNINTIKSDILFMRKLLLSSSRIFNTKGTKHSIDMVMAIFGFGEDDYELSESYYTTTPKEFTDELYEKIENINYYKDYPKNYDDVYSGVPLKDIFIGKKHLIVPYYNQSRVYDGDFIFESRGGWAKKDNGDFTETLSYLHVVSDFSYLLDLNPNSLNDGDIYYVVSLANYTDYVNTLPDNLSHFFYLKENGKYNPQLPESWENVDMEALDDEHTKKAKYLNGIISSNVGNNPHVGYGTYDEGIEFKDYMEKPFKYCIDEYLLEPDWKTEAENITYTLNEGEDSDKVKVLIDDDASKYYINRKYFVMKNKLDGDAFKKYFTDVIVKYVMQVIPSTVILVLEGFDSSASDSEIDEYGELTATLSYPNLINSAGTNSSSPVLKYKQTVYMKDGSVGEITSGATISYNGTNGHVDATTGIVSGVGANPTSGQRTVETSTVTVSLNGKTTTATASVYQEARTITGYGNITVTLSYPNNIPANGGLSTPTLLYSQIVTYSDGTASTITSGGTPSYTSTSGHVNSSSGVVSGIGPNSSNIVIVVDKVTVTVSMNGKTGTATADVHQDAKAISGYGNITVTLSYPTKISSDGSNSSSPNLSYSQVVNYTDGTSETINNDPSAVIGYSGSYTNASTGVVSGVPSNSTDNDREVSDVTVTVSAHGQTGTARAKVYQSAKTITGYSDVTVHLSYPMILPADGTGSSTPTLTYSQTIYYSDGSTETITSGAESIVYSGVNGYANTSNGTVQGSSVGANLDTSIRVVETTTVTVVMNGKSGSAIAEVKQEARSSYQVRWIDED